MKKKKWYRVLAAVLAAIVLFSSFIVLRERLARHKEKKEFDELAELVITEEDSGEVHLPVKQPEEKKKRNLSRLFAKNGDCIGWLCIPDTAVNYPVMHTPDEPQKYLKKNFYGSYSFSGVPFLDARCTLENDNPSSTATICATGRCLPDCMVTGSRHSVRAIRLSNLRRQRNAGIIRCLR